MSRRRIDWELRFWDKVAKSDGCWEWQAHRDRRGYGRLSVTWPNGKREAALAHRLSWILASGPIPEGLHVLHRCDNPPCVNPAHLFLGDDQDNVDDMWAKGRGSVEGIRPYMGKVKLEVRRGDDHWKRRHPERIRRGVDACAKLSEDDVRRIFAMRKSGCKLLEIANQFGVNISTVSLIAHRKTWAHITGELA